MIYNAEILKFSVYNWEDSKYKHKLEIPKL